MIGVYGSIKIKLEFSSFFKICVYLNEDTKKLGFNIS